MRFALLGPVRVHGENGPLEIRGSLRRTLLAALLLSRGSVVSVDRLSELLWGASRPAAATPLYNQVMRLRQALGDDGELIHAAPPGYLLRLDAHALDLDEFRGLCAQARDAAASADWPRTAELFAAALAIWRGEILADVPALHNDPSIHQFTEDRLLALQGRIEADLNLARHDALIGELKTLTLSHPLREAFHAQLMLAFHRAGRQADALGVYRDLRHAIVAELGVEPGSAIRALHTKILNSDPALVLAPRTAYAAVQADTPGPPTAPVPRQLPADTRIFEGRRSELDELADLALSTTDSGPAAGTVVISAINGMGGVGKTALAVRAAHRIRERFPDGQLFIDLHGYCADLDPVAPEDALDYLLRSLGVPPQSIPADVDERAAHYRSRLAGSRTLIVLDNAVNAAQVRPLLPAAPGCLVLITSRSRLTSLDDAHLLALDVLSPADAATLLRAAAGPSRAAEIAREAEAVAELVGLCGRLPLAIRIAAARLRLRDAPAVSALVAELREEPGQELTKSLDVFLEIRNPSGEEWAVHELARLHHITGNFEPVEALLDRALRINLDVGYLVGEAEVRNSIAAFRTDTEGPETGLELYRAALDLAVRAEHPLEQARALEGMARCEARLSLVESGVEHLEAAVDLYERMRVVEHEPAAAFLAELTGTG